MKEVAIFTRLETFCALYKDGSIVLVIESLSDTLPCLRAKERLCVYSIGRVNSIVWKDGDSPAKPPARCCQWLYYIKRRLFSPTINSCNK